MSQECLLPTALRDAEDPDDVMLDSPASPSAELYSRRTRSSQGNSHASHPRSDARSNDSRESSNGNIVLAASRRLLDSAVLHRGTKCRIVQASQILAVKQPHPIRTLDRSTPLAPGEKEEEISQHEWDHFLKNEAQHRWEAHIYELLQQAEPSARPIFHANILPAPYMSERGIYMLLVKDDLEQRVARAAAEPVCDFHRVQWIQGVTRALAWLESKGLVYCNLHPRHVLLYPPSGADDGGEPLLCDFSMTERAGGAMPTRYDLRDFRYLSTWADERSPETDLWSLGCLGYFLITGHAPFAELQHRRAMNLLEEKWHPDFWNGEASALIPFVSKCWYCEHCAPRGNVAPFRDLREAARYWDEFVGALVNERSMVAASMCRLSFHERPTHLQILEKILLRSTMFLGSEKIEPLAAEARRIDRGEATPETQMQRRRGPLNAAIAKRADRIRGAVMDPGGGGVQYGFVVAGVVAAAAVAAAVYHRYAGRK